MPRRACVQLPGVALHLTQRGRTGAACFSGARDRIAYLDLLRDEAKRLDCTVHAYVLMGNHVHLLLTPAQAGAATLLLRALGERHARDGDERPADGAVAPCPRWEDGFDASPVHAARHLFACMRYIELNPVRAKLAPRPADWRWSSHRANAFGEHDALVVPHRFYYALGRCATERQAAYRAKFG